MGTFPPDRYLSEDSHQLLLSTRPAMSETISIGTAHIMPSWLPDCTKIQLRRHEAPEQLHSHPENQGFNVPVLHLCGYLTDKPANKGLIARYKPNRIHPSPSDVRIIKGPPWALGPQGTFPLSRQNVQSLDISTIFTATIPLQPSFQKNRTHCLIVTWTAITLGKSFTKSNDLVETSEHRKLSNGLPE